MKKLNFHYIYIYIIAFVLSIYLSIHPSISFFDILDSSVSCSDMKTIRNGTAAVTVIFAFFTVFTFVGSIYGSIGACCAPQVHLKQIIVDKHFPNSFQCFLIKLNDNFTRD